MTNVSIEEVTLKVLVLNESEATQDEVVTVKLGKASDEPVIGTDYYLGEMKYKDPATGNKSVIDMVSATFIDGESAGGSDGKITLTVKLKKNDNKRNTFIEPLVTVTPNIDEGSPLHCIAYKLDKNNPSKLEVTFIEPENDESIAYPHLYFHTAQGVIDPGMSVRRLPPQH